GPPGALDAPLCDRDDRAGATAGGLPLAMRWRARHDDRDGRTRLPYLFRARAARAALDSGTYPRGFGGGPGSGQARGPSPPLRGCAPGAHGTDPRDRPTGDGVWHL